MKKIASLLAESSKSFPFRRALKYDKISITYDELDRYVNEMTEVLKAAGCTAGVSVGLLLPSGIEYVIAFFATSKAGGTIVPIDPAGTDTEVENLIKRCNVSIMISGKLSKKHERLEELEKTSILLAVSSDSMQIENKFTGIVNIDHDLCDVALLLGTSGSTGKSKFVMLTDENLIMNVIAYKQAMNFEGIQKVFCIMPMHHIYHITAQLLPHLARGDELHLHRAPFNVKSFLKTVQDDKISITSFVPYMINVLAKISKIPDYDFTSLEAITISGAKVSVMALKLACKRFPQTKFLPTYGLTEGGSRVAIVRPEDTVFPVASVGTALPDVQVRIDCPEDNQSVGEIIVKSKSVMKGYYKDRVSTSETVKDGWLRTGDLGCIDESNYLHIVGRKKNLIISGGMNIYPPEIEEYLREHIDVADSAVLPISHDLLQEVPCAFIESNAVDNKVLMSELRRICIKKLSLYKVPYKFICLGEFPRLSNSKVDYSKLRELVNEIK